MSDAQSAGNRATSFGQQAGAYDRARPEYPVEAVAWMLGDDPATDLSATGGRDIREVADVGAGTGKLSRAIAAAGRTVVAVDPDPVMLETLAKRDSAIRTVVGSGEQLPLDDASVDAVTYGQAWHWVDRVGASREAGRVLRPGGVLGLIWNIRDDSEPWVAEYSRLMEASSAENLIAAGGPSVEAPFAGLDAEVFTWTRELTGEQLAELAVSRSTIIAATAAERAAVLAEIHELADRVSNSHGVLRMPYRTYVYRAIAPS